jgi:hypothetical protein
MPSILPLFTEESSQFQYNVVLEGKRCNIELQWNIRCGNFFLHFRDGLNGEIRGVKVVENFPLLANHKHQIDFDGEIMVMPGVISPLPLTYDNFGTDWLLCYMTADDFLAWESAHGIG